MVWHLFRAPFPTLVPERSPEVPRISGLAGGVAGSTSGSLASSGQPPAADGRAERMTGKGPIDPPYPSAWEVDGRSGRWIAGLTAWFAGVAVWLLGYEWQAAILLVPGLA
jgi:hypothetical protein